MHTSKEKIIVAAMKLFWFRGYRNTGINEILEEVGVSKGSFFYHFADKKTLFLEVIDYFYEKELKSLLNKHFDTKVTPANKIINFCNDFNNICQQNDFYGGCILGNLSLELADLDDVYRKKLDEVFEKWKYEIEKIIKEIPKIKDTKEIVHFIIWGLEGIMLSTKVHKNSIKNKMEFRTFRKILKTMLLI
jgi:TetR/AcrR family transcriptional repressor of nem operon